MNIIILGPQGSGKGTQADILAEKLGLSHFEAGAVCRKAAETNQEIDEIINKKGGLIPDITMLGLLKNYLKENRINPSNIIFDGFPRNKEQYNIFSTWLKENNLKIDYVILIDIKKDEIVRRLSNRRICVKCAKAYNLLTAPRPPKNGLCTCGGKLITRDDDTKETIEKRLSTYEKSTKPLLGVLERESELIKVDGEQPIEKVTKDILDRIKQNG